MPYSPPFELTYTMMRLLTEAIQSEEKTRVEVREKTRVKTTDQILDVLNEPPHLALIDVANRIGRSVSTVERAVSKLKQEGRLEYQGPKKNSVWVVREI
jgi:predicted HTH transcriptional regulator